MFNVKACWDVHGQDAGYQSQFLQLDLSKNAVYTQVTFVNPTPQAQVYESWLVPVRFLMLVAGSVH